MPVFALLPLASFVFLALILRRGLPRAGLPGDLAGSLVVSAIAIAGFVALATEFVSLFGWLSTWPVVGLWLASTIALAWLWRRERTRDADPAVGRTPVESSVLPRLSEWRTCGFWLWVGAGLVVLLALLVALASPPNTHDAMAYHLPRQLHWMQMGRVRHFATNDMRQLSFPPLAEYLQMHTMLLASADLLVHVPQWAAYAGTVLAAALLCRALGYAPAAPLAALLAACQPMAYLQAASPKNDPVLMFLLVAFAWLTAEALRTRRCGVAHAVLIGGALGLAVLTKSTAIVLLFPLCALVGVTMLWQHRAGAAWRGGLIAMTAALLIAGHTARNMDAFGHPLGPLKRADGGFSLSMETHAPAAIGSNLLRNMALHALHDTPERAKSVERVVRGWHERLGWNADDPRTTWHNGYEGQVGLSNEGRAPAPLHVLFAVIAIVPLTIRAARGMPGGWLTLAYWASGVAGFLFFVSVVKWNPWHARLHAPLIAFMAASTAIGLLPKGPRIVRCLVTIIFGVPVFAFVVWAATVNVDRPLTGPRGVLGHVGEPHLRWRHVSSQQQAAAAVESLWRVPEGPIAVLAGNQQYMVMRAVMEAPGQRPFTHLDANLGRTPAIDPRWRPPVAFVSAYHVTPVHMLDGRVFVRQNPASSINLYALADRVPPRAHGDPMADQPRYSALADPEQAGRMAQPHSGRRAAFDLALPASGFDVPVPGDGQPRTLLLSLNPWGWPPSGVVFTLDGDVLHEAPPMAMNTYTVFEVPVPGLDRPGVLRLQFPEAKADGRINGATAGWLQLPTTESLQAYDARTKAK